MKFKLYITLILMVLTASCTDPEKPPTKPAGNQAPKIEDVSEITKLERSDVSISAVATDVDGSVVNRFWQQTDGDLVKISGGTTETITFQTPEVLESEVIESGGFKKLVFLFTAVDNEGASSSRKFIVWVQPQNELPTLDVVAPTSVHEGETIELFSNASDSDSLDNQLTIEWEQINAFNNNSVFIENKNQKNISFIAPEVLQSEGAKNIQIKVTVTDYDKVSVEKVISIDVLPNNIKPLAFATAGGKTSVLAGDTVQLIGSGTDEDGLIASYQWQQINTITPVSISNEAIQNPVFTMPELQESEVLTFLLVVKDQEGQISEPLTASKVEISQKIHSAPIIEVNETYTSQEGRTITLTAIVEAQEGVDIQWENKAGERLDITNSLVTDNGSGNYTAENHIPLPLINSNGSSIISIVATNLDGTQVSKDITINLIKNNPPISKAGEDQIVAPLTEVRIDGSNSSDMDGNDVLTFDWQLTYSSIGAPVLDGFNSSQPTISFNTEDVLVPALYEFTLTVSDDLGKSSTDEVAVMVSPYLVPSMNDTGVVTCVNDGFDDPSDSVGARHNFNCDIDNHQGKLIPEEQDADFGNDLIVRNSSIDSDFDGAAGFSFVKLSSAGEMVPYNSENWSCVRDNVTGHIWEVKTITGLQGRSHTYSWYNSSGENDGGDVGNPNSTGSDIGTINPGQCFDQINCDTEKYIGQINALNDGDGLCGMQGWRLPTKLELISLVDYSISNAQSGIDLDFFPNNKLPNYQQGHYGYWTSSHTPRDSALIQVVDFQEKLFIFRPKELRMYTRLVNSSQGAQQ